MNSMSSSLTPVFWAEGGKAIQENSVLTEPFGEHLASSPSPSRNCDPCSYFFKITIKQTPSLEGVKFFAQDVKFLMGLQELFLLAFELLLGDDAVIEEPLVFFQKVDGSILLFHRLGSVRNFGYGRKAVGYADVGASSSAASPCKEVRPKESVFSGSFISQTAEAIVIKTMIKKGMKASVVR